MLSGNTSDRQWHPDWLEQWAGEVPEDFWRGSCYISDAAVVTQAALTRVAGLGYLLLLALQFARFMRAVVRAALQDQPPLELPYRRVTRLSDTLILGVLQGLDMRYQSDGAQCWYQWAAVRPYQRRILEAPDIPIDHGFVWDASG